MSRAAETILCHLKTLGETIEFALDSSLGCPHVSSSIFKFVELSAELPDDTHADEKADAVEKAKSYTKRRLYDISTPDTSTPTHHHGTYHPRTYHPRTYHPRTHHPRDTSPPDTSPPGHFTHGHFTPSYKWVSLSGISAVQVTANQCKKQ